MDWLHSSYTAARHALDTGDVHYATALLDDLLGVLPLFIDAQQLRGEAFLHVGRHHDAITLFERVLAADPEHVDALYGLGAAHHYLHDDTATQAAWERALEIEPQLAELRALVQHVLPTLRSDRAEQVTQAGLARLYIRSGMLDQAIDVLRDETHAQPHRIDLAVVLAETLWRAGRVGEAEPMCYDLLALRPQLAKPTLLLAHTLLAHDKAGGSTLWLRAWAQDPLLSRAHVLFSELPDVPLPTPAPQGEAVQPVAPNDDDALLLDLIGQVPPDNDEVEAAVPSAPTRPDRTLDDLLSPSRVQEAHVDEQHADVTANKHAPAIPAHAFDAMLAQADAEPANNVLHLAVARVGWHSDPDAALSIYKRLVKDGALLDEAVDDLRAYAADTPTLGQQRVYQVLGDALMRQHRVAEAMHAYKQAFRDHPAPQPAG